MMSLEFPPGPKGNFLTGNLVDFKNDPMGLLERCARDHGDIVRLHFFTRPVYLLSHPDYVDQVLGKQQHNFAITRAPKDAGGIFGNGMFTTSGAEWRRSRRAAQPAFNHNKVPTYGELIVSETNRWTERWRDGETRNLHKEMVHLTLGIVARLLFDADISEDLTEFSASLDLIREHYWLWWTRLSSLLPVAIPTRANLGIQRAFRSLDEVACRITRDHSPDSGDNLLSFFRDAAGPRGNPRAERQLRDDAMTLLVTGYETTAAALAWCWYLIATHPEAEHKLEDELDSVLGERQPAFADLGSLSYARMVAFESMRLYPPAWALNRIAVEKCEIGGYPIPKGASVLMSQWVIHRDSRFFESPEEFRPERWDGDLAARLPKYAYFPFGGGQRTCIGREFAILQLLLTLVTVARKFRFRLTTGSPVEREASIILRPKGGLPMVIRQRHTKASSDNGIREFSGNIGIAE
jgi:cytochrome P450